MPTRLSYIRLLVTASLRRVAACAAAAAGGTLFAAALMALAGQSVSAVSAAPLQADITCGASIQTCINTAAVGSTLIIPPGTYTESLELNKAISLTGAGPDLVIIQASTGFRALNVEGASISQTVVISGVSFVGGSAPGGDCPSGCGAGILVADDAQPILHNVVISGNSAGSHGGGLYAENGSALTLIDVVFQNNIANGFGGGIYSLDALTITGSAFAGNHCLGTGCNGGAVHGTSLSLQDTSFTGNSARDEGGGAYAADLNGSVTISGGLFENNQAADRGGGLRGWGTLTITGTQFISNSAGTFGGGVAIHAEASLHDAWFERNASSNAGGGLSSGAAVTLVDTVFISNSASSIGGGMVVNGSLTAWGGRFEDNHSTGATGGGAHVVSGLAVTGTQFIRNSAADGGGGLTTAGGSVRLVNALFADNNASQGGQALQLAAPSGAELLHLTIASPGQTNGPAIEVNAGQISITNSIVASHTIGVSLTAGSAAENFNLFFNTPLSGTAGVVHGPDSLSGDPSFVSPPADNYHLTPESAALDTGTEAGVTTDWEGDSRPLNAGVDIGFDEIGNFVPEAVDDSYATAEDTPLTVSAPGVLNNDSDFHGLQPLTASLLDGPAQGTLELTSSGDFTYTPALDSHGVFTFTYRASDNSAVSEAALVSLTVTATNDAPDISAIADITVPVNGSALAVPFSLGDVDGDSLTVTVASSNEDLLPPGNIVLGGGGLSRTVSLTPTENMTGTVSITLTVEDGQGGSDETTFVLTVVADYKVYLPNLSRP